MIKVNDFTLDLVRGETREDLATRVAARLGSVPRFVKMDAVGENEYRATDLLAVFRQGKRMREVLALLPSGSGLSNRDILSLYIAFSADFEKYSDYATEIIESELALLSQFDAYEVSSLLSMNEELRRMFVAEIAETKRRAETMTTALADTGEIPLLTMTNEKITRALYRGVLLDVSADVEIPGRPHFVLLELFDQCQISASVPFAACDGFYKVLLAENPRPEWAQVDPQTLTLKVASNNQYFTISFIVQGTKLYVEYEQSDDADTDFVVGVALRAVGYENIRPSEGTLSQIRKLFFVPNFSFNGYILADMFMNDAALYQRASVNELQLKVPYRSVYFRLKNVPDATAFCSVLKRTAYTSVRVSVSARNESDLATVSAFVLEALGLYEVRKAALEATYRRFVGDSYEYEVFVRGEVDAAALPSAIFPRSFGTLCPRKPTLMPSEEEARKYSHIKFPKTAEEGEQRFYACTDPLHPFMGLRPNTLANKDKFKVLPCCYKKDQQFSHTYKSYVSGTRGVQLGSDYTIKSDKVAGPDQQALLPELLAAFFTAAAPSSSFLRIGVSNRNNSFFESVLKCVPPAHRQGIKSARELREAVAADKGILAACRQSNFDLSVDEIRELLLTIENYVEPARFVRALEILFGCRIVLFRRDAANPQGGMVLPRHAKAYLHACDPFKFIVAVYEHPDINGEMHCEFITERFEENLIFATSWAPDEEVGKLLLSAERKLQRVFIGNEKADNLCLRPPRGLAPIAQVIDRFGKTSMLLFEINENSVVVHTTPICPLAVPEIGLQVVLQTSVKVAEIDAEALLEGLGAVDIRLVGTVMTGRKDAVRLAVHLSPCNDDELNTFYFNERVARCYLQAYLHFGRIRVNEGMKLEVPSAKFAKNSAITSDGEVIVQNEDVRSRLTYLGALIETQRPLYVDAIRRRKFMDEYYVNTSDFAPQQNVAVIRGVQDYGTLAQLGAVLDAEYMLFKVPLDDARPFFFQNDAAGDFPWMLKRGASLDDALDIAVKHHDEFADVDVSTLAFRLFVYRSAADVERVDVEGAPAAVPLAVLATSPSDYYAMLQI